MSNEALEKMGRSGDFDYIVVGGGSAGCVTSGKLVGEFGATVLLLEAGADDKDKLIKMPAGTFKMMISGSPHIKSHLSTAQPQLYNREIAVPQGNVVGGGSSVNVMAYMRGCRADYDRWSELTGGGWSWDDLLPYFRRQEGNVRLSNESHGGEGPLKVSDPAYKVAASSYFLKTVQNINVPFRDDFNRGELEGVGYFQTTIRNGRRCSAADAFLTPIRKDPRFVLRTHCAATRIRIERGKALGVEYVENGACRYVAASKGVILTAGAYVTPKLLMLSGVGPADHLRAHHIRPLVDLPGVGENLQDHVVVRLTAETNANYGYFGEDSGLKMVRNGIRYYLFGDGPVASNGAECVGFTNIDSNDGLANVQLYGLGIMWPSAYTGPITYGVTLMASQIQPKSRGTVRLRSAIPQDDPVVDLGWLRHPDDAALMVKSLRFLRRIAAAEPIASIIVKERAPGPALQSEADLERYLRDTVESAYHPVGTCKAGRDDDPMAVLTADLRVRGIENLRVFDSSMMPNIVSANTNAPVMAVADRAVDLMMGVSKIA